MQYVSRRAWMAILAALFSSVALSAQADDETPLRIIVPTPPGGTNDGVARALQVPLQKLLKRTVLVEYKAGAASSMGSAFVARSKPDGNTLLLNNNAVSINPLVSRSAGYEMSSLTPLVVAAISPMVLIVNSEVPAKDVKGFIEYARKQAQPLPYASSGGVGSLGHLAMESFARSAGIKLLHVPYAGGGPAQMAVSSGEVKLVMTSLNAALNGQVAAGRIRLLGVASEKPTPLVPGVPPISDGLPGFVLDAWVGLLAPAQTPAAELDKSNQALMQALAMQETRDMLASFGAEPVAIGPVPFAAMIERDTGRWGEVVRDQKIAKE